MLRTTVVLALAIPAAVGCGSMVKDHPDVIASDVECLLCSIANETLVTLEGVNAQASGIMARDSTGVVYLVEGTELTLKAYASNGRYLHNVGRRGAGPGEYQVIGNVIVARDRSIHVLDAVLQRHSVFAPNGEFLRSRSVPIPIFPWRRTALLRDGRLVVNAGGTVRDGKPYELLSMDASGAIAVFREAAAPPDRTRQWLNHLLLAARPNGDFVAIRPYDFTIDVYGPDLALKLSTRRTADWIPPADFQEEPSDGLLDRPYTPQVFGAWVDHEGLLWLHMTVPSPVWRPGPSSYDEFRRLAEDERELVRRRPRYESIVEVVDLERRRVVARSRFDAPIGSTIGDGHMSLMVEGPTGEGVRVSRLRLVR